MDSLAIINSNRENLLRRVDDDRMQCLPASPLGVSPWVAMSLLQKAVRRGEHSLALRAAATLLGHQPERLWRRLGGIAYEDVGLGDIGVVALVTSALAGKRVRARIGSEWEVASILVSCLVKARKCRATDDLLMTAAAHPAYERERLAFTYRTLDELLQISMSDDDIVRRALAAWYAVGTTRCNAGRLRERAGAPHSYFDHLCDRGVPQTLVETAREGFRRTGEVLCAFLPLLHTFREGALTTLDDDDLPAQDVCGSVPGWAIDMYSYEGRAALNRLLRSGAESARWVKAHVDPRAQIEFLGGIIFRVEGGLMRCRESWPLARQLRRRMEIEANIGYADATEVLGLARGDIHLLNGFRNVS